jgi:hypothetical protein
MMMRMRRIITVWLFLTTKTFTMPTAEQFPILRAKVRDIQAATEAGTASFEKLAKMHGSKIHRCNYNEIGYIWCDTMAIKDGRTIITEQNLQYYPAKIRYFYSINSNNQDNEQNNT